MSGNEEQIEIELGDEPKVEIKDEEPTIEIIDEDQPKVEASDEKSPKDVEKALKALNKKLEKERAAREDAERRAEQAQRAAFEAHNEASDSNMHLVGGAIDGLKRDQELIKGHLRNAMEVGDYDKAAELQEMMSNNISKINDLERGFQEMKNQRQQVKPVAPQPRTNEVTVDDLIGRVTPRSAEWLKQNRDALPDQRAIRIMARAHEDAVDHGIIPESDEYFNFVENRMGINKNDRNSDRDGDGVMSGASNGTQRRSSPPSAPVSRTPAGSSHRPGVVQLTSAEVEAARISGISPQEYYRNKMKEQNRSN